MRKNTLSLQSSKSSLERNLEGKNYRIILKQRRGSKANQDNNTSVLNTQIDKIELPLPKNIRDYVKNMSNNKVSNPPNLSQKYEKQNITLPGSHSQSQLLKSKLHQQTLQQIQNQVDQLIEAKLANVTKQGIHKTAQLSKINKKMNQIMQYICQPDIEINKNGTDEELELAKRKINIIQKLMADNNMECQEAKRYFQKRRINTKVKNPWQYKYKLNLVQLKNREIDKLKKIPTAIYVQSTNRSSFKAPDKKYYVIKPKKSNFQFKSHPLPRSTYNRDFLIYGTLPRFSYKQGSSMLLPFHTARSQCSSYKTDYTNKKIQKIDFKQLDCYKNKLKDIKISYGLSSESKLSQENTFRAMEDDQIWVNEQKNEERRKRYTRPKTEQCHYIDLLNTESKSNYQGKTSRIISEIKHKQLNDLKYAYRIYAHS